MNEYLDFLDLQKCQNDEYREGTAVSKKEMTNKLTCLKAELALLPDLDLPSVPTSLLEASLLARENSVDGAIDLIRQVTCFTTPYNASTLCEDAISTSLDSCLPSVLMKKDQMGRPIVIVYAYQWDPQSVPFDVFHAAFIATLDLLIRDKKNQDSGIVVVTDWTDFTFRQCMKISSSSLKSLIFHLHRAYPIKFHAIHFVNQPWYLESVLSVVRRFLGSDEKPDMYFHGNNMSTLHSHVAIECLPAELGGECSSHNPAGWTASVLEFRKSSQPKGSSSTRSDQ